MKIKVWGARGSIPAPLKPQEVRAKIQQAILNLPDIDTGDPEAVRAYLDRLPPLLSGTAGGNTTCVEIQTGQETFIIDAGSGLRELGLELMKGPCGRGQGVLHFFFSHPHWDHIQGFPFFIPAFIPGNKLFFYSVHDLRVALDRQQQPLSFPVPLSFMQATLEFHTIQPGQAFSVGKININTLQANHPGNSYAYRFADQYASFVFASDAEYKQLDKASLAPYLDFYQGADLLFFDAQYTLREAWQKIDWGHSSALIGVEIARAAAVKKLVLVHHDPTYSDLDLLKIQQDAMAIQDQDRSRPRTEVIVAYEGLTFDLTPPGLIDLQPLPAGEQKILTSSLTLNEDNLAALERQLAPLKAENPPAGLVIDLSSTDLLTMAGLQALVRLRKEQADLPIVLAAPTPSVRQVIELAGFTDYFAIYPTPQAAQTALQALAGLKLVGQLLKGRYRIESKLGDSQFGQIFIATDIPLNRKVAVTILSSSFSQKAINQFIYQAQQIMNLNHPHIALVFDSGEERGLFYIVAELIGEPRLKDLLAAQAGHPIPAEQARAISLKIIRALEYAHSHGVIHSNLTAWNVLLAHDVKLINFGLGRMEEGRYLPDGPLALLEAAYLAPEQILGRSPGARTDLYALGVIMYELFTGQPPFVGSDSKVMEAHLKQAPRPPRELNPRLSRSLEYLILKLLAKDPDDRYATAHQTHQILSSLIISEENDPGLIPLRDPDLKPFVGRQDELNQMIALWQEVREVGTARLLLIRGEAGIGKSRLVAEFLRQAVLDPGFPVVVGHCTPFGMPYAPYAEIFVSIFKKGLVNPQKMADQAPYLVQQIPVLAPILSLEAEMTAAVSLDFRRAQQYFFETVLGILAELDPAVLFLEDAQFLDEATIALTRFLVRHGHSALLIIAAGRADEQELNGWFNVFQIDKKETIVLQPLVPPAVETYLQSLMGGPISDAVMTTIQRRSRGNPYFIEEFTRHLIEDEALIQNEAGEWEYQPVGADSARPSSLLELYVQRVAMLLESRRLEALTEPARQALTIAALIGPTFDFETWASVLGGAAQEILARDSLDEGLALRLLRPIDADQYRFEPMDMIDILTASLSGSRRQELHRQIAEVMSQREANPLLISQHYEQANMPAQTAHYLEMAGARAMAANAIDEAIAYYQRALALVESRSGYQALGNLYRQKGAAHEAGAAFEKALALAEQAGDRAGQAQILNSWALVSWMYNQYHQAHQVAEKVLNLAGVSEVERAAAQSHLGMAFWVLGRLSEAEDHCRQAVKALKAAGDEASLAGAYNRLGLAYLSRGKYSAAVEVFNQSLDIRRELGDYWGQAYCLNNLGMVAIEQGDYNQAQISFTAAQELFEEIESYDGLMTVFANQARLALRRGRVSEAQPLLDKALGQARNLTSPPSYVLGGVYLAVAQAHLQQGHWAQARAAADQALREVEPAGNLEYVALVQATLAQIHAAQGDQALAETFYQKALTLFEQIGSSGHLLRTRLSYAQFLAQQGRTGEARDLEKVTREAAAYLELQL
jgi:predicted ATPase/phosphoribosyl 1,2-cyclic phosphodiesterase/anti-anti-sigma regulatory factor